MMRATLFVATMLSAGALCACSGFRPHGSSTSTRTRGGMFDPSRAGGEAAGGDLGRRRRPDGGPSTVGGREVTGTRQVCRKGSRPSGWIAIAYVTGGDCPALAKSDSGATTAVLTYYVDRPVDSVLDVCADEPAPRGWAIVDTGADASDACPGVERKGSSTYRIRRVR